MKTTRHLTIGPHRFGLDAGWFWGENPCIFKLAIGEVCELAAGGTYITLFSIQVAKMLVSLGHERPDVGETLCVMDWPTGLFRE